MKQIKTILAAFAVAAVALSCTKELTVTEIQNETETVSIGFSADAIGSKAVFGEKDGNNYPVFWSANDVAPAITVNYNDSFVQATDFSRSSDGRTANFKGEFAGLTGEQVFIAVTPYSCLKSIYTALRMRRPSSATPYPIHIPLLRRKSPFRSSISPLTCTLLSRTFPLQAESRCSPWTSLPTRKSPAVCSSTLRPRPLPATRWSRLSPWRRARLPTSGQASLRWTFPVRPCPSRS